MPPGFADQTHSTVTPDARIALRSDNRIAETGHGDGVSDMGLLLRACPRGISYG
jgi:hypothetical protein